jgi:hypothetical protein
MADTPKLDMPEIAESQSAKYITHNEALRILDGAVQCNVLSKDDIVPPGSPTDGDTYIVGHGTDSTSGDWEGHDGEIAYYKSSAWIYITPAEGWRAHAQDTGILHMYGSSRVASGEDPWIVAPEVIVKFESFINSITLAGLEFYHEVVAGNVLILPDAEGSQAYLGTAATAECVMTVLKDGVEFAQATFDSNGQVATWSTSSGDELLEPGDVITFKTSDPDDATAADLRMTLVGVRLDGVG